MCKTEHAKSVVLSVLFVFILSYVRDVTRSRDKAAEIDEELGFSAG